MDMRRLSEGKLVQENPMEARLREFKAQQGMDQTVPKAAGAQHSSMVEIPQSPIYGADDPQPKGSLPKQSASYSYNPTPAIGGSNSTVNGTTELPGKLASPGGPNRNVTAYKSMALASYQTEKKKAALERNLARRRLEASDSSDEASAQTDSEDEAFRRKVRTKGNEAKRSVSPTRSHRSHASSASSARSKSNRSNASSNHAPSRSKTSTAIPGSPGRGNGDDSSSAGPTTSESEEEGMTAAEKMEMMESHRSRGKRKEALLLGDKKRRQKGNRRQGEKSLANVSLYVAAKQPPWVEAALAEKAAQEMSESEADSSEDERDRTREGKAGKHNKDAEFRPIRGCCRLLTRMLGRMVSKPDTVQRELPPEREWERAEKALSANAASIQKRWFNLWGRCTPKRLTLPVQLRLILFGLNTTDRSKPVLQLAPQLIGFFLVLSHVFYAAYAPDNTDRRLFGERNYMLFVYTVVCLYSVQFLCEHHRECHQGRLLVNFEGRTWQVLNTGVRDRLATLGDRQGKAFRYTFSTIVIYYFTYLWWASEGLDKCNAAELEAGCIEGNGALITTDVRGNPKGDRWIFGISRLVTMIYPILIVVTAAFMCMLESSLIVDRINAFANGLGSAQYVFSRPEAQAEHDLLVASVQYFSERWGLMILVSATSAIISEGLLVSFFAEASWSPEGREARRTPCEPFFLIVWAWFMLTNVARINLAGKRLTSIAVGVSSSRIPLKGFLGRTSWCNYFMSMDICVILPGNMRIDPLAAFQAFVAIGIPMLFYGFDPTVDAPRREMRTHLTRSAVTRLILLGAAIASAAAFLQVFLPWQRAPRGGRG